MSLLLGGEVHTSRSCQSPPPPLGPVQPREGLGRDFRPEIQGRKVVSSWGVGLGQLGTSLGIAQWNNMGVAAMEDEVGVSPW